MKNSLFFPCGLSLLLALAGCNSGDTTSNSASTGTSNGTKSSDASGATGSGKKLSIVVIPKGTTHAYWKSVEAGARKAGDEVGADITFKGPLKESDRAAQIAIVQQFVSQGADAIVLAPLDDVALVKPVKSATEKKIPVVIIDSALQAKVGTDFTSFVSTDNLKGGVLAGEALAKLLGGKGKVVLLRYAEGSDSTNQRETGFLSVMKKNPGITMLVDNRYGGVTSGESKDASLNLVDKLREADGVFTPNESTTVGMLLALRQERLTGKIKFVGFDASPPLMEGLNKDEIAALVVQNPTKMGYVGVKTAVAALKKEKFETMVDTGVGVVTKANLNSPETKEILNENK